MARTRSRPSSPASAATLPPERDPELYYDARGLIAEAAAELAADLPDRPWIVEVGTGNGAFFVDLAASRPDDRLLGIERAAEFFDKLKRAIVRHDLPNARCIRAEVEDVFGRFLPPASVAEIIINFSDPWPKRRHARRRVFRPEFFPLMERVLVPGGTVTFRTDVGWYFNLAVELTRTQADWEILRAEPEPSPPTPDASPEPDPAEEQPNCVVTNYERKGRAAGRSIWSFTARWTGPLPGPVESVNDPAAPEPAAPAGR